MWEVCVGLSVHGGFTCHGATTLSTIRQQFNPDILSRDLRFVVTFLVILMLKLLAVYGFLCRINL